MAMKKFLSPFIAAFLLLLGVSSVLVGCKNATADAIKISLDRKNKHRAIDDSIIRDHLTRHNYTNFTRTDAGLYLVTITSNPQGRVSATGKQVAVKYIGSFVDAAREGIIFDSSINGKTLCDCISITVGSAGLITGWGQGIPLMHQGERKLLFIPSYLAYDASGKGIIGPDTPLVFDMDILGVSE